MIKTWLERANGIWPNELPNVLWAYWMTTHTPIGEAPFRLAFESEVVIPTEVGLASYRISHHNEKRNKNGMHLQLDLLDKVKQRQNNRLLVIRT